MINLLKIFHHKKSIPEIVEKVIPAVIAISVSENIKKNYESGVIDLKTEKMLKKEADSDGNIEVESGSGFIVDKNGIIVTNKHIIVDPEAEYFVFTNNNQKFKAKVIISDPINDIAILKINPPAGEEKSKIKNEFPAIILGNSDKIKLGESVIALGNALGIFKNTISKGIISGLHRSISAKISADAEAQEMRELIQTDAAINPGDSGGPLINTNGEAIGINTIMLSGAENIGLAIPINIIKKDLKDLKKYGEIKRPFLGARYLIINDQLKNKFNLPVDYGAFVINKGSGRPAIIPKSPAEKSGLKEKDIILECNNEKVSANETLNDLLEEYAVGDKIKLKVLRDGKEIEIIAALAERK